MILVRKLIKRYKGYNFTNKPREEHMPLISKNRICGETINVPIALTCQPTKVCMSTCYFAKSKTAIENNLKKQTEVYWAIETDPIGTAERIAEELQGDFLRWNGGGDLTEQATVCINHFAKIKPNIPVWVVTRKPQVAHLIDYNKNVFVHFSLDKSSKKRILVFMDLISKKENPPQWFASYQCDTGEIDPNLEESGISVLFYDSYKKGLKKPLSYCPLNDLTKIDGKSQFLNGTCYTCRRCFSQDGIDLKDEDKLRKWALVKPPKELSIIDILNGE